MTTKSPASDEEISADGSSDSTLGTLFGTQPVSVRLDDSGLKLPESPEGDLEAKALRRQERSKGRTAHETAMLQAQWEVAKKDLERAQTASQRQSEQVNAERIKAQAAARASCVATTDESSFLKRHSRSLILAGLAVAVLMVAGALVAKRLQRATSGALSETARAPLEQEIEEIAIPEPPGGTSSTVTEFSHGVSRLSRALNRFPGVDPETIMLAVNKKAAASGSAVCAFAWNDGQPTVQLGSGGGSASLAGTLSRCAEAVERFR